MALKQDYILKMIEEIINLLVKTFKEEKIEEDKELLETLKDMVDNRKINEAENYLYDKLGDSKKEFFSGMSFYKYLNEKSDEYLEKCNYSREEIIEGMADLSKRYGYGDFVEMFIKS